MMQTLLRKRPLRADEQPPRIDYTAAWGRAADRTFEVIWCKKCNEALGAGKCDRCVAHDVMES